MVSGRAQTAADLHVRQLGLCDYESVWRDMQRFTQQRDSLTTDEIWLVQHQPVYTLGMNARHEHVLAPGNIPVLETDRGGQVTYHGPGQLLAYTLFDLKRLDIGIRGLVEALEASVVDWLASQGVRAQARRDAPGVYVGDAKIAALGLRIKRGCSYHGLALNVNTDLEPFAGINPCGYKNMTVTRTSDLGIDLDIEDIIAQWLPYLTQRLGYQLEKFE